jgi:hypothetical protein
MGRSLLPSSVHARWTIGTLALLSCVCMSVVWVTYRSLTSRDPTIRAHAGLDRGDTKARDSGSRAQRRAGPATPSGPPEETSSSALKEPGSVGTAPKPDLRLQEELQGGANHQEVQLATVAFEAEERDKYWASNSESGLLEALDAVPGRPNFDVRVECRATLCRIAATTYPEILNSVGRAADWEAALKEALIRAPQSEIFDSQVTTATVDFSSGTVTFLSMVHRRPSTK